ncbi:hypothetical protein [Maridesulfovibrio sp.]|uniref:hypothetical protein n=1 Tax=Maridesulfovibrio sp. TaxID=2795000 RepID=UPI0029F48B3A|nr:hypothetical protein [Maridesulfovibrio sp.]
MLTVFYRRFYILLFLVWLGAVSCMFVLAVWGNFDSFFYHFKQPVQMLANSSSVVNGSQSLMQVAEEEASSVRRDVVYEVHKVESEAERFFEANRTTSDMIKAEIQADLAANGTEQPTAADELPDGVGLLDKIEFTESGGEFLARLRTSREVGRVTYFRMENPARLVTDLRGSWRYSVARDTDFVSGFIEHVVLGRHSDRLRLVFHFRNRTADRISSPKLIRTPEGIDIVLSNERQ